MEITEGKRDGVIVLGLRGRLHASDVDGLEHRIMSLIDWGVRRLAVDCADLEFISSAGIGLLIVAAQKMAKVDGKLAVYGPSDRVYEVMDMVGFPQLVPVHDSFEGAMSSLR